MAVNVNNNVGLLYIAVYLGLHVYYSRTKYYLLRVVLGNVYSVAALGFNFFGRGYSVAALGFNFLGGAYSPPNPSPRSVNYRTSFFLTFIVFSI